MTPSDRRQAEAMLDDLATQGVFNACYLSCPHCDWYTFWYAEHGYDVGAWARDAKRAHCDEMHNGDTGWFRLPKPRHWLDPKLDLLDNPYIGPPDWGGRL